MSLDERLQQKINECGDQPDIGGVPTEDISFDEFEAWLKGFVQGKGYKLPNWDDWDVIMATVNNVSWFSIDGVGSVKMSDLEQKEELTVGEFQIWLKALWLGQKTIAKQLPGVEEWKNIKAMMGKVVVEEIEDFKTIIQPVDHDFLKEIIDDNSFEKYYKKEWEYQYPTQPYTAPQPMWIAPTTTTPIVPIWCGGGTSGYVAPSYTTGTITVSVDAAGGAGGGGAGGAGCANGIATSDFVVTNSISNIAGGSTTFTVTGSGVDSALDGMNAAHINGRPVPQYT